MILFKNDIEIDRGFYKDDTDIIFKHSDNKPIHIDFAFKDFVQYSIGQDIYLLDRRN